MNDQYYDLISEIFIKSPSNRMEGRFILYRQEDDLINAELLVAYADHSDILCILDARIQREHLINGYLNVVYGKTAEIACSIEARSLHSIDGTVEVLPHNRMLGKFELLPAPRVTKDLLPIADATVRSRADLQAMNYGETQSLMVGSSSVEEFESFVHFGELQAVVPDLNQLEKATLKLYYSGSFVEGTSITLYQPASIWREYGITYLNKPSGTEMIIDQYIVNREQHCIELDLLDLVKSWQFETRDNYGFIIKSSSNYPTYFRSRESDKSPTLQLRYITTQNYSFGRGIVESELFVYGAGRADRTAYLNVPSYRGLDSLESTLYVHKYEDFMQDDREAILNVSKPELHGELKVTYYTENDVDSFIGIARKFKADQDATVTVSNPDLSAYMTVSSYKNVHNEITGNIRITSPGKASIDSTLVVNTPDLNGYITVSPYRREHNALESEITYIAPEHDDFICELVVNQPDLSAYLTVRAVDESRIEAFVDVPYQSHMESVFNIRHHKQISSLIDVRQKTSIEGTISVSNPDLSAFLYPRVMGFSGIEMTADIRQKYVSNLDCVLMIKGRASGTHWYIL
ncbi:DNRLRE domain-containing protein [Paenibacillus sp. FSL K6-1230]|uniref:DNRLRE domain-containing protein n=1 Tax=Paenibacillus sp. FSL K6-1230 TaxID=2921603 RepID=UPI0030F632A2